MKKFKSIIKVVVILLLILVIITSVGIHHLRIIKDEVFTSDGMSITLTNEFWKTEDDSFTACYTSENVSVYALREEYEVGFTAEGMTIEEYAEKIFTATSINDITELGTYNGLNFFEYAYEEEGSESLGYVAFIFKTDSAFWLIQFGASGSNVEAYYNNFFEWAATVKFE